MESKWAMLRTSVVEVAAQSYGQKVIGSFDPNNGLNPCFIRLSPRYIRFPYIAINRSPDQVGLPEVPNIRACTLIGGNLASLPNTKVYNFIRAIIHRSTGKHTVTWVGGYDAAKEGLWLWSDGSKFSFKGWHRGEPNNAGGENCMGINFRGRNYVNDARCRQKKSFICAKAL
ncbi:galactose-specific lectin nattectin-like [Scomber scombrus]|uniref:galactose-specific lectin nattectin-like n=1 Tax=Scomber scombrus TaxID=13677 RepID=UPI002DD8BC7E|nr:galactose-specific lectin nattectin-like [Scomber scombrus]